jgi:hypothetical protein
MMQYAGSNVCVQTSGGSQLLYEPDEYEEPLFLKKYGSQFVVSDE